jgi:exopolyphosphatase/guanosine-5'-triphosphate,3'-diphosphate pyrophosphatase
MNQSTDIPQSVYAAIDLGSNSFHMLVATPEGNSIRKIDSLRMPTRLAAGLDKNKRLMPETEALALDALAQYAERLRDVPLKNISVVGTNTLRRAKKREHFMREAERLLGKPIEIISGREEARLIYSAVSHTYPESEQRRLVLDIGGGSTELALGKGAHPALMESVNMGCVSYTNLHLDGGEKVTAAAMKQAMIEAQLELQPLAVAYRQYGWDEVVGCSGTIKAAARMLAELAITDGTITRVGLRRLARLIITKGNAAGLKLTCISQSRTQVIAGGIAVLRAIMKTLDIDVIHASQVALREGLIFEMLGKAEHLDIQSQTIANLTARYSIDIHQANRVENTAIRLFNHVAETWNLDADTDLQLLVWGAKLHELGMGVSHTQYHKHGAYILENSDLLGFTQAEQNALALLVRYHRRKIEHQAFEALTKVEGNRLSLLLSLLRLSALLHRGRYDDPLDEVNVIIKENQITVVASQTWLDEHPLTYTELLGEAERLTHVNIKLKAEKIG